MLTLQLLGLPQARRDGAPLTLTRRKSRALLFYLAAHARPLTRPLSRNHLLAAFWPDLDRPAAQQTLRTALHGLRRARHPRRPGRLVRLERRPLVWAFTSVYTPG